MGVSFRVVSYRHDLNEPYLFFLKCPLLPRTQTTEIKGYVMYIPVCLSLGAQFCIQYLYSVTDRQIQQSFRLTPLSAKATDLRRVWWTKMGTYNHHLSFKDPQSS